MVGIIRKMRIQVSIEANNLKNVAGLFRGISDPYCIAKLIDDDSELSRTDTVKNNLSPRWSKPIFLTISDPIQPGLISLTIKDDNLNKSNPRDDVFMGNVIIDISRIISCVENDERLQVQLNNGNGEICLYAHESEQINQNVTLQFRGLQIKNIENGMTGLGKTDPFIQISKKYLNAATGKSRSQLVYRSEAKMDHLNPVWDAFDLNLETLCDGDFGKILQIGLWDWEKSGQHRYLGTVETTLNGLIESVSDGGNADKSKALRIVNTNFISSAEVVGYLIVLSAQLFEY